MKETLAVTTLNDLCLLVHGPNSPTQEEWASVVAAHQQARQCSTDARARSLTITYGGAPNSAQRNELNEATANTNRAAILSDVTLVKCVVTAFSWFNKTVRFFSLRELEAAMDYLEIHPSSRRVEVLRELSRLHSEIGQEMRPGSEAPSAS